MRLIFYLKLWIVNYLLRGTRFYKLKRKLLKNNIRLGENVKIVAPIYINYKSKLSIGDNTWIGKDFYFDGNGNLNIGANCDIAPNVRVATGGHKLGQSNRRAGLGLKFSSNIGNGCWIGTNVLIINGAKIENSSVVGAGSVVTRDIESNVLATGNPATIKKVFINE